MSQIIKSTSLFYDAFTEMPGGGLAYLNGNIIDRIKRITNIEFFRGLENITVNFSNNDDGAGVMIMSNPYDNRSFSHEGFSVGCSITLTDADTNSSVFTITEISEDGKSITVDDGFSFVGNIDSANCFDTTAITAIDYYYNLIANTDVTNFTSIVDPASQQKFSINGISCTDSTPRAFSIGTKSYAWVTEKITDADAGTTNAVSIKGTGLVDFKQSFEITQFFTVTPFYLVSQLDDFKNIISPSYFPMKFVCRVDGKYLSGNPVPDMSIIDNGINGVGSWYDEAALGSLGEYSFTSIVYLDNETSESLSKLDVNKNCKVEITINSRNGKFANGGSDEDGTMMIIGFNSCPSDETEYQNTPTTQRENFFQDSCTNFMGDSPLNGLQFGTGYQSITDCYITYVSPNSALVTFVFTAGYAFKNYWQSKENGDRYYAINVITQDVLLASTRATDRMTVLCGFDSADYETKTTNLFDFTSTGLEAFKYPDLGNYPLGSIEGFQGDPFYVRMPFRILQHFGAPDVCKIKNIIWQVVGEKTGADDFVFEQKIIDYSNSKKLLNVQVLDYFDSRGFITYDGDPCNEVVVISDSANDTSTQSAFIANYGLILRYESWVNALQQFQFTGTEISVPDISKDIHSIIQDWTSYNDIESWNLFLRFTISIQSLVNNSINNYQTQIPLIVSESNQVIWSGSTESSTSIMSYWNQDESEQIDSIVINGISVVRYTLTGDFPLGAEEQYYGNLFATNEGGSIFSRRLASSELPSESDSPFSPTEPDLIADFSWAFGNCRINVYTGIKIVIDAYFDSTIYGLSVPKIDVRGRVGVFKPITS